MLKKLLITGVAILAIIGFIGGTKYWQIATMIAAGAAQKPLAETVTAAGAVEQTWPNLISATGSVAAVQGVTVASELPGQVSKIAFEAGAKVNEGDLLVQLDTSLEEAQLRAAEASADLAKANADRAHDLIAKSTISQSDFDATTAQFKQATAAADQIRATIAKKTIRAPFTGRLGLRLVNLGQILKAGDSIAALQTLDPVYVDFSLPQQQLSALHTGVKVLVTTDAAPGKVFEGKVNAISPEVDQATRNIRVQSTVSNDSELLRAGMFANVEVELPTAQQVLVIPATAVLYAPYGDSVFVIDEKKDADGKPIKVLRQQFIRTGPARGDFVSVTNGLKPGDQIVTTGVFKLRPGTMVLIDNTYAPDAKLDPKPDNT